MIDLDNILDNLVSDIMTEATSSSSHILMDTFGPRVQKVLSTPAGSNKFKRYVGEFVDRNGGKLLIPGPTYQILFTPEDKQLYYNLFGVTEEELKEKIKEVTTKLNDNSSWLLIRNNPIFVLFTIVITVYAKMKNQEGIHTGCAILIISMYPSMFSVFFKFAPNPAVMNYTIDNLTNKFAIKKSDHLFDMLTKMTLTGYKFHEKNLLTGDDAKMIAFIIRVRNDFKSAMKKITNEFMKNHREGKGIYTVQDSYEDNQIADIENNSNKVATIADKVAMGIAIDGPDSTFSSAAAISSEVSVSDFRNYLTLVCDANHTKEISTACEHLMASFLYEKGNSIQDIHTKNFLTFAFRLYKKSNSKDKNVEAVKNILDKWIKEVGISAMYSRVPTLSRYRKAFYTFLVFSIQKYA